MRVRQVMCTATSSCGGMQRDCLHAVDAILLEGVEGGGFRIGSQRRLTDRWRADLDGAAAAAESKLKGEFAYAEVAAAGVDTLCLDTWTPPWLG